MRTSVTTTLLLSTLLALAIPPLVFLYAALDAGLSMSEMVVAMSAQYGASRQNLMVCGIVGLFPLALLAIVMWGIRRFVPSVRHRRALVLGGAVPILAVLLWVNLDFWPLFLPTRAYPGFPHGLSFVIGPGLFAPIGMVIGMVIAWLVTRRTA